MTRPTSSRKGKKPREWWAVIFGPGHEFVNVLLETKKQATWEANQAKRYGTRGNKVIHVREVPKKVRRKV